jgi:hypothetical protein
VYENKNTPSEKASTHCVIVEFMRQANDYYEGHFRKLKLL